jgi:2,4-dienoyl-CoA reductase-like NADH-dependent reductase (Old Yellow Enzyme family)
MVVERITYKKGWRIGVHAKDKRVYIQLHVAGVDATTGRRATWSSAKAWVSDFACDQELVGVVFKLIKDAEMHELREWFRYRDAAIYNPHLNPDALVKVAQDKSNFMVRADSMTNV